MSERISTARRTACDCSRATSVLRIRTACPCLCLAGLTRNSRDFLPLADKLGADRRLLCPDYRGRGRSQYASDVSTYNPVQELADVLALARPPFGREGRRHRNVARRHHRHADGAARAERLEGAVLNDIGPRLEKDGLLRIARHLGVSPRLDSWDDAVEALKATNSGFEALRPQQWLDFAKRVFRDEDGRPKLDYDAGLAKAFPTPARIARGGVAGLVGGLFGATPGSRRRAARPSTPIF